MICTVPPLSRTISKIGNDKPTYLQKSPGWKQVPICARTGLGGNTDPEVRASLGHQIIQREEEKKGKEKRRRHTFKSPSKLIDLGVAKLGKEGKGK